LITATDIGVMQYVVEAVSNARFVEMPETSHSYGHMTLAHPEVCKQYLVSLLASAPLCGNKTGSD
jgi:homoserine O-acetyltransferase